LKPLKEFVDDIHPRSRFFIFALTLYLLVLLSFFCFLKQRMLDKCQKIANHGINCFINRQLIYNLPEQFFAEKGITAIEHADFEGIERLALVTGAEIVSTFDHPELVKLGTCKVIEEVIIGEDKV